MAEKKSYKVRHNILGAAPDSDDPKNPKRRLHAFKLHRPGSVIELDDVDAEQQIAVGHIEPDPVDPVKEAAKKKK